MNKTETRAEIVRAIQALVKIEPETRIGHLMAALGKHCADLHGHGLETAPDTELLDAVWHYRPGFEEELKKADRRFWAKGTTSRGMIILGAGLLLCAALGVAMAMMDNVGKAKTEHEQWPPQKVNKKLDGKAPE